MSSSTLATIQTQLTLYGYPILTILSNIGNICVIIYFSRQRQNACTVYLFSSAIMNILYLLCAVVGQVSPYNYGNGTILAIVFCKMYHYIPGSFGQMARLTLVLACIDRYLITSNRVGFRALSTPKRAKYLIIFLSIFWLVISIHMPIMITVVNGNCIKVGIYSIVYTLYALIFLSLIPSITSAIFGYLTYQNMRQRNIRVQPVINDTNNATIIIRRRDRDLLIIVIAEVLVYVITTALYPLVLLETVISQYVLPNKSLQHLQIESFLVSITVLLLAVNSAAPFYIYLISSRSFRCEFKQLIINSYLKLRGQPPVQIIHQLK